MALLTLILLGVVVVMNMRLKRQTALLETIVSTMVSKKLTENMETNNLDSIQQYFASVQEGKVENANN